MQNFNLHTHTERCKHATHKDEEYVLAAIYKGIKILGFSDHLCFPDNREIEWGRMRFDQIDEYIESLKYLREKYKKEIKILIGFEAEYFEDMDSYYKDLLTKVDYLILGQHYNEKGDHFYHCHEDSDIEGYSDLVIKAMRTGYFTYIAHPDFFMNKKDSFTKACKNEIEKIVQEAARLNIPLEFNCKGYVKTGKYPSKDLANIISKYKASCIFGSDAHNPLDLLCFDSIQALIRKDFNNLNLNYLTDCPVPISENKKDVTSP